MSDADTERRMEAKGYHRADMSNYGGTRKMQCCQCGRTDLYDDGTGVTRWHKPTAKW